MLAGLREFLGHAAGAGTEVAVTVEPGIPFILADKGQLETSLVNLAANARDAMPNGGKLTLRAAVETIGPAQPGHPPWLSPGRYVRLTVADTGSGMDAATLLHAGEPFFTTKRAGEGTGLGLAMAKGFATQSGGALHIDSSPDQGTTVTLWLPEARADCAPVATAASVPRAGCPAGAPVRLLLVDDEALVRDVLGEQLENAGFCVRAASGGAQALALLDSGEEVDILVSDFSMPGMDGLAVIRAARQRQPCLPAVLLTGYSGDAVASAVASSAGGRITLLRKPIGVADLVDRIQVLLAGSEKVG
jgi:CheY-like chemotaxis protein